MEGTPTSTLQLAPATPPPLPLRLTHCEKTDTPCDTLTTPTAASKPTAEMANDWLPDGTPATTALPCASDAAETPATVTSAPATGWLVAHSKTCTTAVEPPAPEPPAPPPELPCTVNTAIGLAPKLPFASRAWP